MEKAREREEEGERERENRSYDDKNDGTVV